MLTQTPEQGSIPADPQTTDTRVATLGRRARPQTTGEPLTVASVYAIITGPELVEMTAAVRAKTPDCPAYTATKKKLPTIIPALDAPAGTLVKGMAPPNGLYNGLYGFDLDEWGDQDPDPARAVALAATIPGCCITARSAGRTGAWAIIAATPAQDSDDYKARWRWLADHLPPELRAINGESSKNSNRLRYLAHDPQAWLNANATPVHIPDPEPEPEPDPFAPAKPATAAPDSQPAAAAQKGRFPQSNVALLSDHVIEGALDAMAAQQAGADDSHLLAVLGNMKALGHPFEHFDTWAAAAGCTCSDRRTRWDTPPNTEPTDRPDWAIVNLARKHYGFQLPTRPAARSSHGNAPSPEGTEQTAKDLRAAGWLTGSGRHIMGGSVRNARLALIALGHFFWYDEWSNVTRDGADLQIDRKALIPALRSQCEDRYAKAGYAPTADAVNAAISATAQQNRRNPVFEKLRSKPWDGVDLLAHFGHVVFGTPDTDLHNEQAALLVRGAVVRALRPGATFPYIPIIYSEKQGPAKGKALKIISPGKMLTGAVLNGIAWEKTLGERLKGVSITEIPEVEAMPAKELAAAKKLATDVSLTYRAAYGHEAEEAPVPCIFVMTTNRKHILTDIEHRRSPVIEVPPHHTINLTWLKDNIEQCWAQVVHEFDNEHYRIDETGTLVVELRPDLWAAAGENSRQYEAPNELQTWLEHHLNARTSIPAAMLHASIRAAKVKASNQEFGEAMQALGWVQERTYVNGKQTRQWVLGTD